MWYRVGRVCLMAAALAGALAGSAAIAQQPGPIRLNKDSEAGKKVTGLFALEGLVVVVDARGTRLVLPTSIDPPPRVVLARKVRKLLRSLKDFLKGKNILDGSDVQIKAEVTDNAGNKLAVEILIGGTGANQGRSVTIRKMGPRATNKGIFIAAGGDGPDGSPPGDGPSGSPPGKGGGATVNSSGGALAIAFGGEGGKSTKVGGEGALGGPGQATSGNGGQAIAIGGMGGTGGPSDAKQKGGAGGKGGLGQGSSAEDVISHGGTGGTGGPKGATIAGALSDGKGGDGGDGKVVIGRFTRGGFAKGGTRGSGSEPGKPGKGRCIGSRRGAGCTAKDGDDQE